MFCVDTQKFPVTLIEWPPAADNGHLPLMGPVLFFLLFKENCDHYQERGKSTWAIVFL